MRYRLALTLLTGMLATSLAGCATTKPDPVPPVTPCPALPTPPPGLIPPPEAPAAMQRLEAELTPQSPT